jgi:hypothetical protein
MTCEPFRHDFREVYGGFKCSKCGHFELWGAMTKYADNCDLYMEKLKKEYPPPHPAVQIAREVKAIMLHECDAPLHDDYSEDYRDPTWERSTPESDSSASTTQQNPKSDTLDGCPTSSD